MSGYILNFNEIHKSDVAAAGGKGANLGEMTGAGMRVPDGFVISAEAYRYYMRENGLGAENRGSNPETFREAIRNGRLPEDLAEQIRKAYEKLSEEAEGLRAAEDIRPAGQEPEDGKARERKKGPAARVAVRSSATAEDLEDASFAGQQETYLNVVGTEELLRQIKNCYASLWGERAAAYRQSHGYDQADVALAVVVQLMAESEKAGVLFTADPVSGRADRIRINASYGLGESVVSGRVTADSYTCDRNGTIENFVIGDKKTRIVYADGGEGGTLEEEVPEKLRLSRCLSDAEVKELVRQAVRIEQHYGRPMDIEWGIVGDQVYILQARAITTLKEEASALSPEEEEALIKSYVSKCRISGMLKSNMKFLLEKMPAPFYPLDDHCTGVINNQKANIFSEIGLELSMQPQIDDAGITILPPSGKKLHKEIFRFFGMLRELKDYEHCRTEITARMEKHRAALERISSSDYENMTVCEAAAAFDEICDFVGQLAYDRFKYAMFPSFFVLGPVMKRLHKADPDLTEFDLYANLDYRTALVSKGVAGIAEELKKHEAACKDILAGMRYEEAIGKYPELEPVFEKFLKEHGYKLDFNIYCLYATSYIEAPDRLLNIVKPLLTGEPEAEDEHRFEKICGLLKAQCGPAEYEKIRQRVDTFRYFHVIREESQYYWEKAFYYCRCALRRISALLYGTEDFRKNVAYLFIDEFRSLKNSGTVSAELQAKIDARKANRPLAKKVWEQCKMVVFGEPGETLRGIAGSTGTVTGPARIITSPEEFYKMRKGDILVCRYTDPEWTPLFKLAAGVVADTGSELSHAAIVAREYGIPAVLGVGYGVSCFQDDELICVDGNKGEVFRISK